jgi:hypothetical protein
MSAIVGFWRRQFLLPPTRAQTVWDVLTGMLLPLACLAGDRMLFGRMNHLFVGSIFGPARIFCYGFILTEVVLLGLWILLRRRLRRSAGYFTGPLLAGWLFCGVAGLALLPLSVVGVIVVVGVLGFSPWFTGFAFFRNWRMARALSETAGGSGRFRLTLAGIVFAVTPALVLHTRGEYLVRRLVETPASERRLEQARRFPLFPLRELVGAWKVEPDPGRRAALSNAHLALTGSPLDPGLRD